MNGFYYIYSLFFTIFRCKIKWAVDVFASDALFASCGNPAHFLQQRLKKLITVGDGFLKSNFVCCDHLGWIATRRKKRVARKDD